MNAGNVNASLIEKLRVSRAARINFDHSFPRRATQAGKTAVDDEQTTHCQ